MTIETQTRQPVISRELAEQIADLFETRTTVFESGYRSIPSPYSTVSPMRDYSPLTPDLKPVFQFDGETPRTEMVRSYMEWPEIVEVVKDLPEFWTGDVYAVQGERAAAIARAERVAAIEAIEHPAIRAYLLARVDERGHNRKPETADLSSWTKLAAADHRRPCTIRKGEVYGKAPYQPEPGCKARLHLKQAISFYYTQEAYADHSSYAIPVTVEEGADMEVCKRNLRRFADALKTHTGLAGSGSTWSMDMVEMPEGVFVIASGRHSISD